MSRLLRAVPGDQIFLHMRRDRVGNGRCRGGDKPSGDDDLTVARGTKDETRHCSNLEAANAAEHFECVCILSLREVLAQRAPDDVQLAVSARIVQPRPPPSHLGWWPPCEHGGYGACGGSVSNSHLSHRNHLNAARECLVSHGEPECKCSVQLLLGHCGFFEEVPAMTEEELNAALALGLSMADEAL